MLSLAWSGLEFIRWSACTTLVSRSRSHGQSLHLTVGLRAPTRFAIVEALLRLAADEPSLRAGLPIGTDLADRDAIASAFADTVKALHSWLDRVTPDEVAAMIAYVCSALASATTGAALRVDGGVVRSIV